MKTPILAATLCALAIPAAAEITVMDRNDRTIILPGTPTRVVCLLNRCAEEMAAIGAPMPLAFGTPWTIGVARDPLNYGEEAQNALAVPHQGDEPEWEAVAALEPDLIIGNLDFEEVATGIAPLYTLSWDDRNSNDAWFHDARAYGAMFGMVEQVERQIQGVIDKVSVYSALSPMDRTVAVLDLQSDDEIGFVNECDFFMRQVVPCIVEERLAHYTVNMEFLLDVDPDVIVIEDYAVQIDEYGDSKSARLLAAKAEDPLWNELKAVRNGEVYLIPVRQAKPNSLASIEATMDTLMPLVYPETFPEPLTDEEVDAALSD